MSHNVYYVFFYLFKNGEIAGFTITRFLAQGFLARFSGLAQTPCRHSPAQHPQGNALIKFDNLPLALDGSALPALA